MAKRTLKFLSVCKDRKAVDQILRTAPPPVVKALCNIALNAAKNKDLQGRFTPKQKSVFSKHRAAILTLADRGTSLKAKHRVIQSGGAIWIPLLAGAVSALLGNSFLGRMFK